jgi:hypothetical protein
MDGMTGSGNRAFFVRFRDGFEAIRMMMKKTGFAGKFGS